MFVLSTTLTAIYLQCSSGVPPETLDAIIKVESAGNQYAVAIVQNKSDKNFIKYEQPTNLAEAYKVVELAKAAGKRYSVGLMQVNNINFKTYGLSEDKMFDACENIKVGSQILSDFYKIATKNFPEKHEQERLRIAASYYYSGNPERGFVKENNNSYVGRINNTLNKDYTVPAIKPLDDFKAQVPESKPKKAQIWDVFNDF